MKYSQSEKMEIIRMVEGSNLSVRQTLREIGLSRSTFYEWYRRFQESGYAGLASRHKKRVQFWNEIPVWERIRVLDTARLYPEMSCREVAFHITDKEGYFISESSVYRILKAHDLVTSPVYTVISAMDEFEHPTTRVNELWQLSDNGPCFISHELKDYLENHSIRHIRTRTYHPMTQGKIERYHRSMKNLILLDHYHSPSELEARIAEWVDHYNNHRYHEAIGNVTPHDRYLGLDGKIQKQRIRTKSKTMELRRKIYQNLSLKNLIGSLS
jgi:putative transposase